MALEHLLTVSELVKKYDHEADPIMLCKQSQHLANFIRENFQIDEEILALFKYLNTLALDSEDVSEAASSSYLKLVLNTHTSSPLTHPPRWQRTWVISSHRELLLVCGSRKATPSSGTRSCGSWSRTLPVSAYHITLYDNHFLIPVPLPPLMWLLRIKNESYIIQRGRIELARPP